MSRRLSPYLWLPVAGFVLGWWLRGTPASRVEGPNPGEPTSGVARTLGLDEQPVASAKVSRRGPDETFTEADRRREIADRERMQAVCRAKLELKVAEWRRELGLTAGQVSELREAIGPAIAGAEPPVVELALPRLEEALKAMLEGDHLASYQELQARKAEALDAAKVEARLAEIGAVLLLAPAQQEALREVLGERAEQLPDPSRPAAPGLSPAALAEITRRLGARNDDGSGFAAVAAEVVREEIEAGLEGLESILSADQLESYRTHLEEARAQWLQTGP